MTFFLPLPFMHSHRFCLLKHFSTDLFFSPFLFLYLSVYTQGKKKRYTAIFTRMLTEGGHHLCKLSEIVTSSLPSFLSEKNLTSQITQGTLLSITLTIILPLTAPLHMIGIFQSKHASLLPERASLLKQTSCLTFEEMTSQHQKL